MQTPEQLIGNSPFLSLLPPDLQGQVVDKLSQHEYEFGDRIVAEGEAADAFYLILSGKARVLKTLPDGGEVPLHSLSEGESFGEIGLLTGGARTATVRATGRMVVLRLDRADFAALLADNTELREFIHMQLRHRQVQSFLRQYTEFSGAPLGAMEALLKALTVVTLPARQMVFSQGDDPDGMYIIEDGHARVFAGTNGDQRDLAFLRPGDFFGELSLLAGNPRTASVEAASECRLLKLEPREYARLMDQHPQLRAVVETRMASYHAKSGAARMPLDFWCATKEESAPVVDVPAGNDSRDGDLTSTFELIGGGRTMPFSRRHFVQQIDGADSGAAALAMAARHLGQQTSVSRVRDMMRPAHQAAATSELLCETAGSLGFRSRTVKSTPEELATLVMPCPALMEADHWVLLAEVDGDRVRVADPATGIAWVSRAEFVKSWSRLTIELLPGGAPDRRAASVWSWLPPALRTHGAAASQAVVLTLFASLAIVAGALMLRQGMNARAALQPGPSPWLMGLVALAIVGLAVLRRQSLAALGSLVDRSVASSLVDRISGLSVEFLDSHRRRELENRLRNSQTLQEDVVQSYLTGLTDVVTIAVCLSGAALFAPMLAAVLALTVAAAAAVALGIGPGLLAAAARRLARSQETCDDRQSDMVVGLETIKSVAAEGLYARSLNEQLGDLSHDRRLWHSRVAGLSLLVVAVWAVGFVVILTIGLRQVPVPLKMGGLLGLLALVVASLGPLRSLVRMVAAGVHWQAHSRQFERILVDPARGAGRKRDSQKVHGLAGKLELRHASLYYSSPSAPAALRDLTVRIEAGEHVVIVGRSGSGKSSVFRCLAGMTQPQKGSVLLDDVDLRHLDEPSLRQHLGIVPQTAHVFEATVTENIALGDDSPDLTRVQQAARDAGLHDAIRELPDTYDTLLGRHGWILPMGQQRALAIARALYRQPDLLLLDEPTADMDIEQQTLVWENILARYKDRTVVMVTTDLHLARLADRILVLERGHVAEEGTHDELIKRHGVYFHLHLRVDSDG